MDDEGFILLLFVVALLVLVFALDAPEQEQRTAHFVAVPQHMISEGVTTLCLDDVKPGLHVWASRGRVVSQRVPLPVNTAVRQDGSIEAVRPPRGKRCIQYQAPSVDRKTVVILKAKRHGQVVDRVKLRVKPLMSPSP